MKITANDVARWTAESEAALVGGWIHRIWRAEDADGWVLLVRHHRDGDPDAPAVRRVALALGLHGEWAHAVAVAPESVDADDRRAKKAQARDSHPFLSLLRRSLVGARVEAWQAIEGDRVAQLRVVRRAQEGDGPRRLLLSVELIGRAGNLILAHEDDPDAAWPRVVGSLHAGRAQRSFDPDGPYRLPPARPGGGGAEPAAAPGVEADSDSLALGEAVLDLQREEARSTGSASVHDELRRALAKARRRAEGVLGKLAAQLERAGEADAVEAQADLLKANLAAIPRGARSVRLTDYSGGAPVEVELALDPTASAKEQMQALYKRARKLRSGEVHVRMRQGETDAFLAELGALEARLEELGPDDDEALAALRDELVQRAVLPKPKQTKVKQQQNQGPRSYRTREGHEVLVGRSDEENDRLTMRTARGRDLFFHVRGCPGSHVILRVDASRPPNHESLLDAAALAVHFSKARNRGAVDVSYTPRKWVTKPKGAKPGLVRISNEKTVRAGGDPERLRRVLESRREEER